MSFGTSAVLSNRYRFVNYQDLRVALLQFCRDFGINDLQSVALMERNLVFTSSIDRFWNDRAKFFSPNSSRDQLGQAAADFMGAETFALLFGHESTLAGPPLDVPLIEHVMRRGARGLYFIGQAQFEKLAQICVDLAAWLVRSKRMQVLLIESPLGNSVPVAVFRRIAEARGISVEVLEWGCPRNDRAALGRTVKDSAKDISKNSSIADAQFVLFIDDAITGSRFLKMASELRKVVGPTRFGAIALRAKYSPKLRRPSRQPRSLHQLVAWASQLGLPFGLIDLPDLPAFRLDEGPPAFLETALAWGDAGHSAGKRKVNLLFQAIDRYEAILNELISPGNNYAKAFLTQVIWSANTSGGLFINSLQASDQTFFDLGQKLPKKFFEHVRQSAIHKFTGDYYGRPGIVANSADLRLRTDWLNEVIELKARPYMSDSEASFLARAVKDLSHAGYTAGVDKPPRDHDYGQYTIPMRPKENCLHLELIDLTAAHAETLVPSP